ncbi:MAG: DUF4829 domain-containing protein, partial [Lachnoclostridium sp.]|nr:DUF4829 domain-containing protein [Lachnospira sp.]MCM1247415.1 DUF4829 domain-containing protein [Lachnoclostridium sp.]
AMAQGRGRLCNGLSFGKGRLNKRVRHILQNRKSKQAALAACTAAGITVLVCLMGAAFYYKRDVQGFTRWEVEDAKEALVNYVDASNSGKEEEINLWVAENSRLRGTIDYLEGGDAVYDITYLPKDWEYQYAIRAMEQSGLDKNNCIYLLTNYVLHGKKYTGWFFFIIRENKDSPWKVYDMGMN